MQPKIILITGASSGMGKATAMKLIENGHIVYGAARRIEAMTELEEKGGHRLSMDITREEDIISCVDQIIRKEGRIDVLINNAGYAVYGPVEEVPLEMARRQFEVNLFGLASLTQRVIPHMRQQSGGRIINISSMGGKIYTPLGAWYHATKHALEGWSDCLRLELKPFGIQVVIIEPGIIDTGFAEAMTTAEDSPQSPYHDMVRKVERATLDNYQEGKASSPIVVANAITKAVNSTNPRTRYVMGKMAKPLTLLRKLLPDRLFDRLVMSQV